MHSLRDSHASYYWQYGIMQSSCYLGIQLLIMRNANLSIPKMKRVML